MTQEIEIPMGIADKLNMSKVRNLIITETGRIPHTELNERSNSVTVFPESPIHADNIMLVLDSMDIEYYHE